MELYQIYVNKIFGSNTYLRPGISKSGRPYLYLQPEARVYKDQIKKTLQVQRYSLAPIRQGLILVFGINRDKDVTNMVKLTEDAIAEYYRLNDIDWTWSIAYKYHIKDRSKEWIAFGFSDQALPHWEDIWLNSLISGSKD